MLLLPSLRSLVPAFAGPLFRDPPLLRLDPRPPPRLPPRLPPGPSRVTPLKNSACLTFSPFHTGSLKGLCRAMFSIFACVISWRCRRRVPRSASYSSVETHTNFRFKSHQKSKSTRLMTLSTWLKKFMRSSSSSMFATSNASHHLTCVANYLGRALLCKHPVEQLSVSQAAVKDIHATFALLMLAITKP